MVNTERFTPLLHVQYTCIYIRHHIRHPDDSHDTRHHDSMENLHFGKEDFSTILFSTVYTCIGVIL